MFQHVTFFAVVVGLIFVTPLVVAQTTIFVDANAAPGGDGTPGNPFDTIQEGIDAASNGDTVVAAIGIYQETIDFLGKAITVQGEGDPFDPGSSARLDGALLNAPLVNFGNDEGLDSVLTGFEITGGNASQAGTEGGAVRITGASPSIVGNFVHDNEGFEFGGAFFIDGGSPLIEGNHFLANRNIVIMGPFGRGGAICGFDCDGVIRNNTFEMNGGVTEDEGGAVYLTGVTTPVIEGNVFTQNSTSSGGAVFLNDGVDALVRNNLFVGNLADGSLGFAGAIAGLGGALAVRTADPNIINNTFLANNVTSPDPAAQPGTGGGIFLQGSEGTVTNCILWENDADDETQIGISNFQPGNPVVTFSDVQGGFVGAGNIDVDPLFVDPMNPGLADLHLSEDSPAIDVGDAAAPGLPDVDFDGDPRVLCDGVDMGFDEATFCVGEDFRRGDADGSGIFNGLVDGLFALNFQFVIGSPAPPCMDAADADDSGGFNGLVDGLLILNFQFIGGPPPPDPGPSSCGPDPTDDALDCETSPGICL